jgi:dihydropteroate synthase
MRLRGRTFGWGERTYLMAIVNVTPDSFSGDGQTQIDAAIEYAVRQWNAGADMLDIGGESTRPGHEPLDELTELSRVIPVIAGVRARLRDAVISVDTYKAGVVGAAREAGADIVNSVWGASEDLIAAAAAHDMPIAVMHNQRTTRYDEDVVDAVVDFLRDCAERALQCGIGPERIMLDPGIGFGKTPNHNIRILRNLDRICALGFPTLLGTSRKSTIGKLTGREPHERIYGTAATTALGIAAGIDIVRVHDVAQNRDVISVSDAIVRDWRPSGWTG